MTRALFLVLVLLALPTMAEPPQDDAPTMARLHSARVVLLDETTGQPGQELEVRGGWYVSEVGYSRMTHAFARLQVERVETSAQGEPGGVSAQAVLLVGALGLLVGLAGGLYLARR